MYTCSSPQLLESKIALCQWFEVVSFFSIHGLFFSFFFFLKNSFIRQNQYFSGEALLFYMAYEIRPGLFSGVGGGGAVVKSKDTGVNMTSPKVSAVNSP